MVHFKIPYITSDLGPFLSPYITFESNIRALWSPYFTLKIYKGLKIGPSLRKVIYGTQKSITGMYNVNILNTFGANMICPSDCHLKIVTKGIVGLCLR